MINLPPLSSAEEPTTYVTFTPEGGRIGRITWDNGDEYAWGSLYWDQNWPPMTLTSLGGYVSKLAKLLQAEVIPAFQAFTQSAAEVAKAFGELGPLMAQALPPALPEDQEEPLDDYDRDPFHL